MALSKWVGYAVSVNCVEPLGCYQGTILETNGTSLTLTKAFRNGFPYPKSQVTLNAADIKDLKIIETRSEPSEQTHSTVAVTKSNKKSQRATVCENLQANPSSSGNPSFVNNNNKSSALRNNVVPVRSKPIDIQGGGGRSHKNSTTGSLTGSGGGAPGGGSTPRGAGSGAGGGARRRNEACFGEALPPDIHTEFDFEKNLALFDKRGLWEQMRAQKPDLVRQTEAGGGKYRHDENVLGGGGGAAISVPLARRGAITYVTGGGVRVPSAEAGTRASLLGALGAEARVLLARAAADVALRLVGGERRLDPRNAHQAPAVVALCGAHPPGAAARLAARLLAAHGARVSAWAPGERLDRLPSPDLVLLALLDHADHPDHADPDYSSALRWVSQSRASVVCIEPPPAGYEAGEGAGAEAGAGGEAGAGRAAVAARASVVAVLSPPLPPSLGQLYLANVAPPLSIFTDLNITYRPPFGASSVLALYPRDD